MKLTSARNRAALPALWTAALVLASAGCAFGSSPYREAVHTRAELAPKTLELNDPVGDVAVDAWTNRYVQIDAVKRAASAGELRDITISVVPSGSTLRVGADLRGSGFGRSVDFTIHAPPGTGLKINVATGDIRIAGFTAGVRSQSAVGDTTIDMAAMRAGQTLEANASVGDIRLTLPHNADATIDADTAIGEISGDVPFSVESHLTGAKGRAVLGSGAGAVTLSVATGTIRVNRE